MRADTWTLRQRMLALCALVAALLAALAAAAATTAAVNRSQVSAVVDKYTPLHANSERLLVALVNQETAIRGFALTGDEADLSPYQRGLADERALTDDMHRLLSGEEWAQQQLIRITQSATQWRAQLAEPVIAAVRSGGPTAGRPLITDDARRQFDALRTTVGDLQATILQLREAAGNRAKNTSTALAVLLVVAGVVVLLAGVALALLLERLVARPVTALAGEVRRVAGGEYDREISSEGPPELANLATNIDGMRRQIVRDLREVRQARQSIEEINARLEAQAAELTRSNRDLEQFAYVASHDLQEPLRKVASFCQLLQRRYAGQLDERADQYIAFAVNGAQRMQRLINDLLAFSRIGRMTNDFTEVDLNRVAEDVISSLDALTSRTQASVTVSSPLPVVRGEESLLSTLIANLISNSVKFRQPDVPPRVELSARRDGEVWEVSCADNGIGIEADYADKVFVIFQRLHPKDAYPGTGIGLSIAKKIVEYHGGRIWVDPGQAEGTTIRFTLPVVDDDGVNDPVVDETGTDQSPTEETPG